MFFVFRQSIYIVCFHFAGTESEMKNKKNMNTCDEIMKKTLPFKAVYLTSSLGVLHNIDQPLTSSARVSLNYKFDWHGIFTNT